MPTTAVAKRYYPKLSEVITLDDLPEFLSFAREGLAGIFDKIHYKNLQYSKSYRGDAAFYSLDIVSREIGLNLPFGLRLILNPDEQGDPNISSFPVTLEYQWEILAYLRAFKLSGFSFTPEAFYELGLQIFRVTEDQVLAHTLNYFVEPVNDTTSKFEQLVSDINTFFPSAGLVLPANEEPTVSSVVSLINQNPNIPKSVSPLMFGLYLLDDDLEVVNTRLQEFYNLIVPEGIEAFIRKLIIPKAKVSLKLSAAIEFPTTVLQPVDVNGNIIAGTTKFKFAEALLYADTEAGIGYKAQIGGSLIPQYSQIGNTGLIIEFSNALLDLSTNTNIPQADAAGYPADFTGLYIEQASIRFSKFGQEDTSQTSIAIIGKDLLIGTGGFSGTIGLEAEGALYRKFGNFAVELNEFAIGFRQNVITGSSISGKLTIPSFKQNGNPATLAIQATIFDDGDFKITALPLSAPLKITLPDVLELEVRSLSVGNEDDRYYVEIAGKLSFIANVPVLGDVLPKSLEIYKFRIWDDGKLEFAGGSFPVPKAFRLEVGPVKLEVTNITLGSYRKEKNGLERRYNFFGFDGMINTGRAGVNATGNGIKYYFSRDNDEPGKDFDHFVSIDGIGIDLTIPGNASKENAAFLLNGYLAMKTPNPDLPNSQAATEYTGSVSFSIPRFKLAGTAGMRLQPDIPAFLVDIGLEVATPIPIGATGLGIYGFRGLIGQHYLPAKSAVTPPLPETGTWWDYFKTPSIITGREGIEIDKFASKPGFSIGAGVSIATNFDSGKVFSSKLFLLLGLPDVFLIQGQAAMLRERIGLQDDVDPPFSALIVIGDQSIRGNLGVNFNLPDRGSFTGGILSLQGNLDMAFFFNNASGWYLNIGKDSPESERVRSKVLSLFQGHSYLMLSSRGIKAGAGVKFDFNKKLGPVGIGFGAYLNMGGFVSFKPIQIGGYIQVGGYAYIRFWKASLGLAVNASLAVEAPNPFNIRGSFEVSIKVLFKRIRVRVALDWTLNSDDSLLREPIPVLQLPNPAIGYLPAAAINMLSNESFMLNYVKVENSASIPSPTDTGLGGWFLDFTTQGKEVTVPIDSFIDIELLKPVKPSNGLLGGASSQAANGYTELLPPQKGHSNQVKHEYELVNLEIVAWDASSNQWKPYHIYEAVTAIVERNIGANQVALQNLKPGYWQFMEPDKYNKIRLMSQHMFSFASAASSPADMDNSNFGEKDVFCYDNIKKEFVIDWKHLAINTSYPEGIHSFKNSKFTFSRIDGLIKLEETYNANSLYFEGEDGLIAIKLPEPVALLKLNFGANNNEVSVYYGKTKFLPGSFGRSVPMFLPLDTDSLEASEQHNQLTYENGDEPIDQIYIRFNEKPRQDFTGHLNIGGHYNLPETYIPLNYSDTLINEIGQDKALMFVTYYNTNFTATQVLNRTLFDNQASIVAKWPLTSQEDIKGDLDGILSGSLEKTLGYYTEVSNALVAHQVYYFTANSDALIVPYHPNLKLENDNFSFEVTAIFNPFEAGIITLLSKVTQDEITGYRKGYSLHLCQFTPAESSEVYNTVSEIPKYKIILTFYDKLVYEKIEAEDVYTIKCDGHISEKQYKTIFISVNRAQNTIDIFIDHKLSLSTSIPIEFAPYDDAIRSTFLNEISYLTANQYKRLQENFITENKVIEEIQILDDNINKVIQPVWRPNTTFAVSVTTQDKVEGQVYQRKHIFGFKTAGPIGHFHQQNPKFIELEQQDREAEFKLSGLKHYIDYERSFPDAQGRFDLSKPVFYSEPQIKLFFVKEYMNAMYANWDNYQGLAPIESKLDMELVDPFGTIITRQLEWQPEEVLEINMDNLSSLPHDLRRIYLLNRAAAQGACNPMPTITKKLQKGQYNFPDLTPDKLYTAIFIAAYQPQGEVISKSEVHKFSFKTSRYADFTEQLNTLVLDSTLGQEKYAVYNQTLSFDANYINTILKVLINDSTADDPAEVLRYAVKFDRLVFGGLRLTYLETLNFTHINLITVIEAGNSRILGILVKSPEPINDPKLPEDILKNTVNAKITVAPNSVIAGNEFIYIHSRDTSSVFITNTDMNIPLGDLELDFYYKLFNGTSYETSQEYHSPSITMEDYLNI